MSATRKLPIGHRVRDLTVIETGLRKPAPPHQAHNHRSDGCSPAVRVECVCGRQMVMHVPEFMAGKRTGCRMCGRSRRVTFNGRLLHGLSGHPLYAIWRSLRARCINPNRPEYPGYGGKGVEIHSDWIADPAAFIAWIEANLPARQQGQSLDRINSAGHYEPGNLRWASALEQRHNRRPA